MSTIQTAKCGGEVYLKAADVEAWLRRIASGYCDAREGIANVALNMCADRIKKLGGEDARGC